MAHNDNLGMLNQSGIQRQLANDIAARMKAMQLQLQDAERLEAEALKREVQQVKVNDALALINDRATTTVQELAILLQAIACRMTDMQAAVPK